MVFPFIDFLKDELRPIEKSKNGETRAISACDFILAILYRVLNGAFIRSVAKWRVYNGMALGVNPMTEAEDIYRWFACFGDAPNTQRLFFAGDFKGWDSSQQPQILRMMFRKWRTWFGVSMDGICQDENDRAREALDDDFLESTHVTGFGEDGVGQALKNIVYRWYMALPSGHPATTIINNFYNRTVFCYVFQAEFPEHSVHDVLQLIVYGDDNVGKVSSSFVNETGFDQTRLSVMFEKHLGLVYTDESKVVGATDVPLRELADVTFLKRRFAKCFDGCIGMILDRESIDKSLYWTGNAKEFASSIRSALVNLAPYPHDVWERYTNFLRSNASRVPGMADLCFDSTATSHAMWMEIARKSDEVFM